MGIAQHLDSTIDLLLSAFVIEKSTAMCSMLVPIAVTCLTIYWISTGLAVAAGKHPDPVKEIMWAQARISVLISLALSAGIYQRFIVDGLDAIGVTMIETITGNRNFSEVMDHLADPLVILGEKVWSKATVGVFPRVGLLFAAGMISVAYMFIFSLGVGFYLLAKVSLALVFVVGPTFILCAIFPPTRKYAESWLGQVLNYVFLKVLVCAAVIMLTSFVSQYAEHITKNLDTINIVNAACALTICTITLIIVMVFLPQLVSALFGGASISGAGHFVSQLLMRWLLMPAKPSAPKPKPNNVSPILTSPPSRPSGGAVVPLYQRNAVANLNPARSQSQIRRAA